MTDDEQTPPPGMVPFGIEIDGHFSINARLTVRSPGYPDRHLLLAVRNHDDAIDAMVVDEATGRSAADQPAVTRIVERYIADMTGWLVDVTTDPAWAPHWLDPTDPDPEDITPLSQPKRTVN
jgi:hypothetical protein